MASGHIKLLTRTSQPSSVSGPVEGQNKIRTGQDVVGLLISFVALLEGVIDLLRGGSQ